MFIDEMKTYLSACTGLYSYAHAPLNEVCATGGVLK